MTKTRMNEIVDQIQAYNDRKTFDGMSFDEEVRLLNLLDEMFCALVEASGTSSQELDALRNSEKE